MRTFLRFALLCVLASNITQISAYAQETIPEFVSGYEGTDDGQNDRAYIIYDNRCPSCVEAAQAAYRAVQTLSEHDSRWGGVFKFYEKHSSRAEVTRFARRFMAGQQVPNLLIAYTANEHVERRFQIECATPIDIYSMAWLYKGVDERPGVPEDNRELVRYPLTGGWWSVEGDWNPSRHKIIDHLMNFPLHDKLFERWWLDLLTYEELQSIHTDHHRELTNAGHVHWDYVNKEMPPGAPAPTPVPPSSEEQMPAAH